MDTKLETKAEALAKTNITRKNASQYELMSANPEIVEQAIATARDYDDIVLRSLVLNMIRNQKKAEQIELIYEGISIKYLFLLSGSFLAMFTCNRASLLLLRKMRKTITFILATLATAITT